jgi:hypothetical protein
MTNSKRSLQAPRQHSLVTITSSIRVSLRRKGAKKSKKSIQILKVMSCLMRKNSRKLRKLNS